MTIHDPGFSQKGHQMTQPERLRRPVPERTKPNRGILGALGQAEGPVAPPREAHPLTPGFEETETRAGINADSAQYINDSVRAASDVVDAHIRQGHAAAQSLGAGAVGAGVLKGLTGQKDGGQLLGSLTRAYTDLAAIWVEVAKSVAGQIGEIKPGAGDTGHGQAQPVALIVDCRMRAETRLDMFRACSDLIAQPLVAQGAQAVTQIADVSFAPGQADRAGVLHVQVPDDAAPGRYYGLLLDAADMSPVGALSLHLKGQDP